MAWRIVTRNFQGRISEGLMPNHIAASSRFYSHATSFGFKEVPGEEKSKMVGNMFSSVASKYDVMNDLMSAGLHRLWKESLVSKLSPLGGTGDVAFRILETINSSRHGDVRDMLGHKLREETQIYVCDINPSMLNIGKTRAQEKVASRTTPHSDQLAHLPYHNLTSVRYSENGSLTWVEGDAEALKFEDDSVDGYTIAFGIRNVTHAEKALSEAYRVLKKGGRFLCLELSHVENPIFKQFYDYYSFSVIPAVGELVAGDRDSYQYLVESICRFPSQEKFASMIAGCGFQKVEYENLVGGVVAIHSGLKI